MEVTKQQIQELRELFFQKLEEEGGPNGGFHPSDLARVSNSDDWLRRFLLHVDLDMKEALRMLWDTCEWRSNFGTNDITENNINPVFKEAGGLFGYNRDKDGKSLLIFRCKYHTKGQHDLQDLKRYVVYWFERLERKDNGDRISVFFDMSECGLSNMDMEFTKFLIGLFKHYYPYFLNYIIVFDMAWVLNAAFKIIKSWLPAKAVERIKFVNKSNVTDFVPADQALVSWGGTDNYVYAFMSEVNGRLEDGRKKVHFAESSSGFDHNSNTREKSNLMLSITPQEVIIFTLENGELHGKLIVTNIHDKNISFKIKTTSPEKFRVRPSIGLLAPDNSTTINVILQPGYQITALARDKFLIMALLVDNSLTDISELWKSGGNGQLEQHRLRCSVEGTAGDEAPSSLDVQRSQGGGTDLHKQIADLTHQVTRLSRGLQDLQNNMNRTNTLQYLTLGLLIILMLVVWFNKPQVIATTMDPHKMYSSSLSDDCME